METKNNTMSRRRLRRLALSVSLSGGAILCLLVSWELLSESGLIDPMFSSSPTRVVASGWQLLWDGNLWKHIAASGYIFVAGYLLAVVVGVPVGILLGWFEKANMAFGGIVAAMYTTPRIALMPLFIIWFGLGMGSKVTLVFLSALFPIIVNMQTAMSTLDGDLARVGRAYGASQRQIFWTIALPLSVPFLITALRLATWRALLGVVGAEVFGGAEGLGYLIQYAGATFQTDKVFVCVFIIAALGIVMDRSLLVINRRFDAWRGSAQ